MSYAQKHLREAVEILQRLDVEAVEKVAALLAQVKADGGRLFFLGVGGSAANCSHAVNDFRKLAGVRAEEPDPAKAEVTAYFKKTDERIGNLANTVSAAIKQAQDAGATAAEGRIIGFWAARISAARRST